MDKSKSVTERLQNIKLQSSLEKTPTNCLFGTAKNDHENIEKYPKLRPPKPATLLKLQARHKKNADISMTQTKAVTVIENKNCAEVPLRQEFLNKKKQLVNVLDDDMFSQDSDEAHPLTLQLDINLESSKVENPKAKPIMTSKTSFESLSYPEQLLVSILHTKVQAHPHGFFAEDLPHWYKRTFDKDINMNWLELLQASNKFYIENVQNKIVLYAKESKDPPKNIDLKTAAKKYEPNLVKKRDTHTELSVGFVRYKHLQKSLQEYNKNAGRDNNTLVCTNNAKYKKQNDKINKNSFNKK